jgi:oxygen-independent coproporphyrinogen-3 oxidase
MCYKVPSLSTEKRKQYLDCVAREITMKSEYLSLKGNQATAQMHWGGGTPTCMEPQEMEMIFNKIEKSFSIQQTQNGSCSIEAFPRATTVTEEKIALLSALGFNEISFGVQDLNERVQSAINRSSSLSELATIVERCRKHDLRVHIDLCYGLPFQEIGSFEQTIRDVLSLRPDRVAMLTYVHYPLLFPNQRNIPIMSIPNSFMRVMLALHAEELFSEAGYEKVGFDHYVLPENSLAIADKAGDVTRDLMGYSVSKRKNFIGFGSSAISFLDGTYYHNAMTVSEYISSVANEKLPLHSDNACSMTDDDLIRNHLIQTSILTNFIIDMKDIESRFSVSFADYFSKEMVQLEKLEKDGLVTLSKPGLITITESGKLFCRHIAAVFDNYQHVNN